MFVLMPKNTSREELVRNLSGNPSVISITPTPSKELIRKLHDITPTICEHQIGICEYDCDFIKFKQNQNNILAVPNSHGITLEIDISENNQKYIIAGTISEAQLKNKGEEFFHQIFDGSTPEQVDVHITIPKSKKGKFSQPFLNDVKELFPEILNLEISEATIGTSFTSEDIFIIW